MKIAQVASPANNRSTPPPQAEVVVIGASIAGLFAAYLLARQGKQVRLFDTGDLTQLQSRTLIATAQLEEVLGFFPQEAVVNRVATMEIIAAQTAIKVSLGKPDLIVERASMIRLLAQRAQDAGVELSLNHRFIGFEPASGGLKLKLQNKLDKSPRQITTRVLVGADGAVSPVASAAGIEHFPRVPLLQAIVEPKGGCDPANVQVWFEPERSRYFFWSIPENAKRAVVGFIADDATTARARLLDFLREHNLPPLQIQAARIPLFVAGRKPWKRINGCDVYLVGDAAGHVKVTTVGGLVTGLWGAKAAAQAIQAKSDYGKALRPLQRELWLHGLIRRVLNRFNPRDYQQLLAAIDGATANLLGQYSRDELAKMALKLIFTQPRLMSFAKHLILPDSNRDTHVQPAAWHSKVMPATLQPAAAPMQFEDK